MYTQWGGSTLLHCSRLSCKKACLIPFGCNEQAQLKWIALFREIEKNITDNEVITFADGVHTKHNTQSECAWIETGIKFEIQVNTGRQRVNCGGEPY